MTTMTEYRLFHGETLRVHSAVLLDVLLDLDLDVRVRRSVVIQGFEMVSYNDAQKDAARHCMVVLAGGKNLVVQPSLDERPEWGRTNLLRARVYLAEKIHGTPIGHTIGLPETRQPVLEIGPFMGWIAGRGFNVEDVKAAVNGKPRA